MRIRKRECERQIEEFTCVQEKTDGALDGKMMIVKSADFFFLFLINSIYWNFKHTHTRTDIHALE